MELVHLKENVYVYPGPINMGVIANGDKALIIDTGIDRQAAKKLVKALQGAGLTPAVVVNTHSHADHIGGNAFLQENEGVKIYAPRDEAPFIENPMLEPLYLLGGVWPWKEMTGKFLCAPPSTVSGTFKEEGPVHVAGFDFTVVDLKGHSHQQVGIYCSGVLFSGDAYISPEHLAKHGIPYNVDIAGLLDSLVRIENCGASWTVPSHGQPCRDPLSDTGKNKATVLGQLEAAYQLIARPSSLEAVIEGLCRIIKLEVGAVPLYYLYRTAVTAYLGYLINAGRAVNFVEGNQLLWQAK